MEPIFVLFLLIFFGGLAYILFKELSRARRERNTPIETFQAVVVGKRMSVSGGSGDSPAYTDYFLTFELEDDSRIEFRVKSRVYAELAEGDRGPLTLQGSRFLSFERQSDRFDADDPNRRWHKCPTCGANYRGTVCSYCGTPFETD